MVMQVQQHLNVEYNVEYRTKARRHMTTARDTACLAPTHCFTLWSQSLQTVSNISSGNHRYLRLTSTQPDTVSSGNVTCRTMPDRLRSSPLSQYHHARQPHAGLESGLQLVIPTVMQPPAIVAVMKSRQVVGKTRTGISRYQWQKLLRQTQLSLPAGGRAVSTCSEVSSHQEFIR